ncbi:MAG TPA: Tex family protein [Burkholderiaceae bacterium]|nr:Tex family protein [Burkholderiaceae bacterium]
MNGGADAATVHRKIVATLAAELGARPGQVAAAAQLLDEGATVPFIARYRKEATGGLDDTQLRTLAERLAYLREMEERRAAIGASIDSQGKLTPQLAAQLAEAETKQRLEDLYAPYKPKRRTRAQVAREAGLEPLADALLQDRRLDPAAHAAGFLNPEAGFADAKAALDGARDILAERLAEDAELIGRLRDFVWERARVASDVVAGKEAEGEKFRDYFAHREPIRAIPSHRALALFRGRTAGCLHVRLALPDDVEAQVPHPCEAKIAAHAGVPFGSAGGEGRAPADAWLRDVFRWTWRVKIHAALESEFFARVRHDAETEAIRVFSGNLKDVLLAPPAGARVVMGLDPGLRTGVKVAVVDATGKLLDTATIHPHEPRRDWNGALSTLAALVERHRVTLVAIGNGTASRETDKLAAELIKSRPGAGLARVVVSEAGASVYSASETAAREFPDLDVSLRGAVSIARRLQDPLAELVKIEPKAIGVGQYQHDVNQSQLARALDAVVEDCVNAVGVDVNTASAALLARVSGLSGSLAQGLVQWRDAHGAFASRADLRRVPRFGDKTFEQAAGFLRIVGGSDALDRCAVHPESYPVVERILAHLGKPIDAVLGNRELLQPLDARRFTDERFGEPTVRDILAELEKPGRDPRPEFRAVAFRDGVEKVSDLEPGMILDGVVTNVANFGAFVDIGVHQDGLVHVSAIAERYVKDPRDVVKAGMHVRVKVLEVDVQRGRIGLSMKLGDEARPREATPRGERRAPRGVASAAARRPEPATAMAAAFAKLKKGA